MGATNNGLYVIDATNVNALTDAVSPTTPNTFQAIPISHWGNIKVGPVFPIGNLLTFGTPKDHNGVVTLDISQPGKPLTLDTTTCGENSYITWFYGKWIFCEEDIRIFDVTTNPKDIRHVITVNGPVRIHEFWR